MSTEPQPITVRSFYNDAGIRSLWLVGDWPARTRISDTFFDTPYAAPGCQIGEVTREGDVIRFVMLDASARYRIIEREPNRGDLIADLIDSTVSEYR